MFIYSRLNFISNRARDAAKLTGLDTQTKLGTLTTGQIRLLSIAAELVGNPTLLLLDDPLSGLDEINALQIIETLGRIARRQYASTTVIYSSKQPGHCLLRHVNHLIIFGGSRMLLSQDISSLSLTPTMKLPGIVTFEYLCSISVVNITINWICRFE